MPKRASKCREWEKDRRNRLNNSFTDLSKKLPCYQPSVNISKIEILQRSAAYIDELDSQVKDLIANNAPKTTAEKIKKLRDQIKKLLIRNEQLCNLLKDAGIRYPSECGLVKFKTPRKWANKITPEQAKLLAEQEAQKENKGNSTTEKNIEKSKKKKNVLSSVQKARAKRKEHKKMAQSAFRFNIAQSNLFSLVTTQSCFIITNPAKPGQANLSKTSTVLTESRILSTPLVASSIKPTGTVLVANNNILPFIHQPTLVPAPLLASNLIVNSSIPRPSNIVPTILTNTPILVTTNVTQSQKTQESNTGLSSSTVTISSVTISNAVIASSVNLPKIPTKSLPAIRPKACTRTTHVNKVPIPALGSEYNRCLLQSLKLNSNNSGKSGVVKKTKEVKKEEIQKPIVIKQNIILNKPKVDEIKNEVDVVKKADEEEVEKEGKKEVIEPLEKKIKLEEGNVENKKIPTTLPYSINVLCNDVAESETAKMSSEKISEKPNEIKCNDKIETSTKLTQDEPPAVTKEDKNPLPDVAKAVDSNQKKINENPPKEVEFSELSNDIFASLTHVASGGQNPESTSPTAAFLLAFPLVSSLNSLKVTEVIEDEATDSQRGTPTLLQIGTMDTTKPTQSQSDALTPSLLNLDNFSFFPKEFYHSFTDIISTTGVSQNIESVLTTLSGNNISTVSTSSANVTPAVSTEIINKTTDKICTASTTTASESGSKTITKKNPLPNSNKTSTSIYSSTKTEASYSVSNISTAKSDKNSKLEKTFQPPPNNYTNNFSYNFFQNNDTAPNTFDNTSEKDKYPQKKKPSCYYPTCSGYSVANITLNYCTPSITTAPYSAMNVTSSSSFSVTMTTASYPLPVSTTINQYNTFNPFTDLPVKTSSYIAPKSYNDMLYTNNSYTYTYGDNLNTTYSNTKGGKDKNYYSFNYDNYEYKEFQKSFERNQNNQGYCYNNNNTNQSNHQIKEKPLKAVTINNNANSNNAGARPPVNWMTTPDIRQQPDFIPYSKEMEFVPNTIYPSFTSSVTQNTYFNTNSDFHNALIPNSFQRPEEENQFSWSHGFMPSTLPTLVGDLALGTQPVFPEQKDKTRTKESKRNKLPNNFDSSQNSFLSVSQLVDHNKSSNETSNPVTNRRNSGGGNRSSNKNSSSKTSKRNHKNVSDANANFGSNVSNKLVADPNKLQINKHQNQSNQNDYNNTNQNNNGSDWLNSNNPKRNVKNSSSSYSAEALIGPQNNDVNRQKNQQSYKSLPMPFLTENLLPYFPPVDIPQENSLLPQNQNYHQSNTFGHNFTSTIQNNVYTNNSFAPTNFNLPDMGNTADYNTGLVDNTFNHIVPRPPEKNAKPKSNVNDRPDDKRLIQSNNNPPNNGSCSLGQLGTAKKTKKKQTEASLPGIVDFSFLPMPAAINSPILPDDFHSHTNFLPPPPTPTQLYSCKNPLYGKSTSELGHNALLPLPPVTRPGVPHPEVSPLNSVGSSLTNFNLSTIFPEINKGSGILDTVYNDVNKPKDYLHRDFLGAPQVSFSKTNPSISYIHATSNNN